MSGSPEADGMERVEPVEVEAPAPQVATDEEDVRLVDSREDLISLIIAVLLAIAMVVCMVLMVMKLF